MQNLLRFGGCLLLSLVLSGCGGGPKLNAISGTVKHQGKPVPNVRLSFVPTGERPGEAVTDENGHFSKVMYDENRSGLISGDYEVFIHWVPKEEGPPPAIFEPPTPPAELKPLLAKYGNHLEPKIQVKIEPGQKTLDLDLE